MGGVRLISPLIKALEEEDKGGHEGVGGENFREGS
jgi:hypothetical protein